MDSRRGSQGTVRQSRTAPARSDVFGSASEMEWARSSLANRPKTGDPPKPLYYSDKKLIECLKEGQDIITTISKAPRTRPHSVKPKIVVEQLLPTHKKVDVNKPSPLSRAVSSRHRILQSTKIFLKTFDDHTAVVKLAMTAKSQQAAGISSVSQSIQGSESNLTIRSSLNSRRTSAAPGKHRGSLDPNRPPSLKGSALNMLELASSVDAGMSRSRTAYGFAPMIEETTTPEVVRPPLDVLLRTKFRLVHHCIVFLSVVRARKGVTYEWGWEIQEAADIEMMRRYRSMEAMGSMDLASGSTSVMSRQTSIMSRQTSVMLRSRQTSILYGMRSNSVGPSRALSVSSSASVAAGLEGLFKKPEASTKRYRPNNTNHVFKGWLPKDMREVFRIPREERTEEDIDIMQRFIEPMKGFAKFPHSIQRSLLKIGRYERWSAGRTLVREGGAWMFVFFILDGEMQVLKRKKVGTQIINPGADANGRPTAGGAAGKPREVDVYQDVHIANMVAGLAFGELAGVNNGRRSASVRTARDSEFFIIEAHEFRPAVQAGRDLEQKSRVEFVKNIPVFKTFTCDFMDLIFKMGSASFAPNVAIISEGTALPETVYFIQTGSCRVVKMFDFLETRHMDDKITLEAWPLNEQLPLPGELPPNKKIVSKLLVIRTLGVGDHFGDASPPAKRLLKTQNKKPLQLQTPEERGVSIISNERVDCVTMNIDDFARLASAATYEQMRSGDIEFPELASMVSSYVTNARWARHRKGVMAQYAKQLPPSNLAGSTVRQLFT